MDTQRSSSERSTPPTSDHAYGILWVLPQALREPIRELMRRVALLAGVIWLP